MSIAPFARSRAALIGAAALIVAAFIVGLGLGTRPAAVTALATASPSAIATDPTLAPDPTPTRTPRPTATPAPTPTPPPPCDLPDRLPPPGDTAAAPIVDGPPVSALFTAPLYRRNQAGELVARDNLAEDWADGLWYVPPRADLRLLTSNEVGLMRVLAMSPDGRTAAIWWLPARRAFGDQACLAGIYVVSLPDGDSSALLFGDWSSTSDEEAQSIDYRPPAVAFSANGEHVALVEPTSITILTPAADRAPIVHAGMCPRWAWSATGATFVAGCDDMTSAWVVGPDGDQQSVAIPYPPAAREYFDDPEDGRDIGLTSDGRIRVVRFHGFATGCESENCTLPAVGYSMTTINPATGDAVHRTHELEHIYASISDRGSWLAADASWVYSPTETSRSYVIDFESARIRRGPILGDVIGASPDGTLLYGIERSAGLRMTVVALDAAGDTHDLLAVSHPADAVVWSNRPPPEWLRLALPPT